MSGTAPVRIRDPVLAAARFRRGGPTPGAPARARRSTRTGWPANGGCSSPTTAGSWSGWAPPEPSPYPEAWPIPPASTEPWPSWRHSDATTALPEASTSLRPVLAFGALPFDGGTATSLLVPETLYCREADGTEWATVLATPGSPHLDETPSGLRDRLVAMAGAHAAEPTVPIGTHVVPRSTDAEFEDAVATVVEAIGRHEVAKVVLARRVDVTLDRDPDLPALLRRWGTLEPNGTLFSLPTPDGQFVGASPELLVERHADHVRARPLAGTTDRFPDASSPLPSELLESTKDAEEHRLVVHFISDALRPWCDTLDVPDRPELVHLHNLTHLGTSLEGTLGARSDGTVPSALHLAALLHPTPAVGGVPRAAALELISRLEDGPRGPYAGAVGFVDGAGDGRFVVGIRAMTVNGRTATLTAGVGVVAGSRPATERDEANLKFTAVFDALAPGVPFDTSGRPSTRA